jgi:hypothetical protein
MDWMATFTGIGFSEVWIAGLHPARIDRIMMRKSVMRGFMADLQ